MSEAPSMPMYWDAYLADTTHLTTEEHGAYMLLLAAMWRRNGTVPDDDKDNARILGLSVAKWKRVKTRLAAHPVSLIFDGDTISQKKLKKTWEKTQEKIQVNRENGALGGRPKSSKNNNLAKANGSVSPNPIKTIPEPEPEPYKEKRDTKVSPKKGSRLSDDWFLPTEWGEWAISEGWPDTVIRSEADKFKDFWISKTGRDASKLDWQATWRNWMRNSKQRKIGNGNGHYNGSSQGKRPDAALEQIARLAGLGQTQGDGRN